MSTDDPPGRSWTRSALCALAIVGVGYLGAVILTLSLFSTDYNPVTQVASDYGVGTYGPLMNSGFLLAGIGVISLALVIVFSDRTRTQRLGALLLLPSGLALVVNAFFQTDIEGAAMTLYGAVHGVGGAVFFFTASVGLLLVAWGFGRRRFGLTLLAFVLSIFLLGAVGALGLDLGGLAERVLILVVFATLILTSAKVYRES